jgi:hypothetical protein
MQNEKVWYLRGADFVSVMDNLWHEAGAGGCTVTWEDFVTGRCRMFPMVS